MKQLFSLESLAPQCDNINEVLPEVDFTRELSGSDLTDELEEILSLESIMTSSIGMCGGQINMTTNALHDITTRRQGNPDYLVSMENYKVISDAIASNLGVKKFVPALEDFSSRHSANAAHTIAVEGFMEFIKNLWLKLKDFFLTFFKRISQFIKRLTNSNLELSSYEKYVDTLIRKIEKKELDLTDNTVMLESKLPSLVAPLGESNINDSSTVISLATTKMRNLARVLDHQFSKTTNESTKKVLKEVRVKIDDVIAVAIKGSDSKTISDKVQSINSLLNTALLVYFSESATSPELVPGEIRDDLLKLGSLKTSNLSIHSLVDASNESNTLPKQYNAFLAYNLEEGVQVRAHSEKNEYVNNNIPPISSLSNLRTFHETYKEYSKSFDIKDSSRLVGDLDKAIIDLIEYMSEKYSSTLGKVSLQVEINNDSDGDEVSLANIFSRVNSILEKTDGPVKKANMSLLKELLELLMNNLGGQIKGNLDSLKEHSDNRMTIFNDPNLDKILDSGMLELIHPDLVTGKKFIPPAKINIYRKEIETLAIMLTDVSSIFTVNDLTMIIENASVLFADEELEELRAIDPNDLESTLESLSAIQEKMVPFLNTLRSHISSTATGLTSVYTETRAAAIKYLYDSARLYK